MNTFYLYRLFYHINIIFTIRTLIYLHRQMQEVFQLKNEADKKNINYEQLGLRIKEARISKNLTQESIAAYVGCNVSHISNIENNHTKVSLTILLAIANALNTSIDYLLSDQYENSSLALDNEIMRALKDCDNEKKQKILKMISII